MLRRDALLRNNSDEIFVAADVEEGRCSRWDGRNCWLIQCRVAIINTQPRLTQREEVLVVYVDEVQECVTESKSV